MSKDKWTQKASIGLNGRSGAIGFSMADKGYIGFGYINQSGIENDMWAYDTTNNKWVQMSYCNSGYAVSSPFAFNIGNTAYVGSGEDYSGNFYNDFYQYTNHTSGIQEPDNQVNFNIYPNPNTGNFVISRNSPVESYEISDMSGKEIYRDVVSGGLDQINLNLSLPTGMYFLRLVSNSGTTVKKFMVKN